MQPTLPFFFFLMISLKKSVAHAIESISFIPLVAIKMQAEKSMHRMRGA